jgi:hypothetical protein
MRDRLETVGQMCPQGRKEAGGAVPVLSQDPPGPSLVPVPRMFWSRPMELRRDEVRIALRRGIMSIPSSSCDALLEQLRDQDSMSDVRDEFRAVGTTQPSV